MGEGGAVIGVGGSIGVGGTVVGGAGGVPTCDPTFGSGDACGGDELGYWTLESMCTNDGLLQQLLSACEGATGEDYSFADGTLTLDGETYSKWTYLYRVVDLQVPEGNPCLDEGAVTCTQLESELEAIDSTLTAFCSSDYADGCDCQVLGTTSMSTSGTYAVNRTSGQLTLNDSESIYDYCVQGDSMTARQTSDSGPEAGLVQLYVR